MTAKSPQFTWQPGAEPPAIESHSDAKLRLLAAYLDRYFDVVCALPQMDVLRIALVDTFAGGGLFRHGNARRYGSPLVMIDAVRRAERRVNEGRRKRLRIDARYFFVDEDEDAIEHLRQVLRTTEVAEGMRDRIQTRRGVSSEVLPGIIREIAKWSATGRSLFFLDQFGYTDAPHRDVRKIYNTLPKSEVFVTYNFGAIYDYMNENAGFLAAMAPFELAPDQIRELLKERERQAGRYFAGRLLGQLFKAKIGSRFASRFFLRSENAGRDMWFVHYSKVPRSRLVMSEAHWAIKNSSVTQGEAGLDMLGFRPEWEGQIGLDFGFECTDEGRMHTALLDDLPRFLAQFDPDSAPTVGMLLDRSADNTAATESQIKKALGALEAEGAVEVLTPGSAAKKRAARLRAGHRVLLPRQGRFGF